MRPRPIEGILLAATLLASAGCAGATHRRPPAAGVTAGPAQQLGALRPHLTAEQARARLHALPAAPAAPVTAYRRAAYGRPWADVDRDGCNQRDAVLFREAVPGTVTTAAQGRCGHDVLSGMWRDSYDGRLLTFTDLKDQAQARALTVDHVVPLADAHRSGADRWSSRRRELFANDLGNLVVVAGEANSSKGSRDPALWRPAQRSRWCAYALIWVQVKAAWKLGADQAERAALGELLATC